MATKTKPRKTKAKKAGVDFVCSICNVVKSAPRRPGGWKEVPPALGTGLLCEACLKAHYVIRPIVLPVAECVGKSWGEFCKSMHSMWACSTDLANWVALEMLKKDTSFVGTPGVKPVLPPYPKDWQAYAHVAENYPGADLWGGAKINMGIVARNVERSYMRSRYEILIKRNTSLATWKYPYPFPIKSVDWDVSYSSHHGHNKIPMVRVRLHGGPVRLRLERKADLARHLGLFETVIKGLAIKCEAAIYRHRRTKKILLKMVAYVPKSPLKGLRTEGCLLHTDQKALLVAEVEGRSPWILNCDHLRRWLQVRETYLQRTGEDLKREKRLSSKAKRGFLKSRRARLEKIRNRINTALEEASAQVAKFCERQNIGTVAYDDTCRDYCGKMPWFTLAEMLKRKLTERGIEFHEIPTSSEDDGQCPDDTDPTDTTGD